MAVQNWALISLALANLSHPAQVSMKDHESLQTTSYIKLHQVTSSYIKLHQVTSSYIKWSFKFPKNSTVPTILQDLQGLEALAPVSRVPAPTKPGHRTSLASAQRHLESSLWWAICDATIFDWLTAFWYPPGNLTAKSIKVQECNSFYSNFTPEWRNSEDKKMGDLASHLSIALQFCGVAFVP